MNKEKAALRYLLLRHLHYFRESVPTDLFTEITKSLKILDDNKHYIVKWICNNIPYEKIYPKDIFKFFVRGDIQKAEGEYGLISSNNNKIAREFAKSALNINTDIKNDIGKRNRYKDIPKDIIIYLLCSLLLITENHDFLFLAIIFPGMFLIESIRNKGKIIVNMLIILFILFNLNYTSALIALMYGVFHYFDSDRFLRDLRCLMAFMIFIYTLLNLYNTIQFANIDIGLFPVLLFSVFNLFWRWTYGVHLIFSPLIFQIIPVGIYLDGFLSAAIIIQICGFLINVILYIQCRVVKKGLILQEKGLSNVIYHKPGDNIFALKAP